jgi:methylenetetrahydrofolate reductase (NADPH)
MAFRTSYSFEFFPPKDSEGEDRLWTAVSAIEKYSPEFVSVTFGAGGSTQHRTIGVTQEITRRTQISTVAHLTCVGLTKQELITVLHTYRDAKIPAILALRGDPHGGPRAPWTPNSAGFSHADALVQLIAVFGGFKIGVAAFPDGHPSSNGNYEKDIEVLLRKENLGASFATTQFFFDVAKWEKLVESLQSHGSNLPIIPGILPVTNVKQLHRMAELGGTEIPDHIAKRFAAVEDDADAVRKLGIEIATQLCDDLITAGAPSLHFYTMNTAGPTQEIIRNLENAQ